MPNDNFFNFFEAARDFVFTGPRGDIAAVFHINAMHKTMPDDEEGLMGDEICTVRISVLLMNAEAIVSFAGASTTREKALFANGREQAKNYMLTHTF
jgi:hypothetical protein